MGCSSSSISYREISYYYEEPILDKFVSALRDDPTLEDEFYEKHRSLSYFAYTDAAKNWRKHLASYLASKGAVAAIHTSMRRILALLGCPCFAAITPEMKLLHSKRYLRLIQQRMVLMYMYNTDVEDTFAEEVSKAGTLRQFVEDLQFLRAEHVITEDGKLDWACESAMTILMNCSRNRVTRETLRGYDLVRVLAPFPFCQSGAARLFAWITLSNLVNKNERSILLEDPSLFDLLIDYLYKAWDSTSHYHQGLSVGNLVLGISSLAKYDNIRPIFVQKGVIPILTKILKGTLFWETEVTALCILGLGFDESNRRAMNEDTELKEVLYNVMQQEKNLTIDTTEIAEKARWLIRQHAFPYNPLFEKENETANPKHVAISNCGADEFMAFKIRDTLEREGFYVRLIHYARGRFEVQKMLTGIQDSAVVLVCLSDEYRQRLLSRLVAEFAFSIRKKIIPLVMQKGFESDGWLQMFMGHTHLYFDFDFEVDSDSEYFGFDNPSFDKGVKHLIAEIEDQAKETQEETDWYEN